MRKHALKYIPIFYYAPFILTLGLFFVRPVAAIEFTIQNSPVVSEPTSKPSLIISIQKNINNINALEGEVHFDPRVLTITSIKDSNSVIGLWVERPRVTRPGIIRFAGVMPGGWEEERGPLFVLEGKGIRTASTTLLFAATHVYRSDGRGQNLTANGVPFTLAVIHDTSGAVFNDNDRDPPEPFTPRLGRTSELFSDHYFVSFTTKDTGSGLDHYELREGEKGEFHRVNSPVMLNDQSRRVPIHIKAIDKNGNVRLAILPPATRHIPWIKIITRLGILGGFTFILYALWHHFARK